MDMKENMEDIEPEEIDIIKIKEIKSNINSS